MKKLMLLGLLLVLLSGCAGNTREQPDETDPGAETSSQVGSSSEMETSAAIFSGTDLEGNAVSSDTIFSRSRLTMVNIWATYCGPCLEEMPGLGELAAEYDAREFQIIGIVSDVKEGEDQTLVESLVRETGANYLHLLRSDSIEHAILGGVSAVPTTFFFNQEGQFLGGLVGSGEKAAWEEIIHGLLEEL